MSNGNGGPAWEGRARVRWTPRGKRGWCPGAARQQAPAAEAVPSGWTSFLHWQSMQGMLAVLRERLNHERAEPAEPATAAASEARVETAQAQPAAALPSLRQRSAVREPALEAWLDETPD